MQVAEFVHQIKDACYTQDFNGNIQFFNTCLADYSGYAGEAGCTTFRFWLEKVHTQERAQFAQRLRPSAPEFMEYRLWHKAGYWVYVESRIQPLYDTEQQCVGYLCVDRVRKASRNSCLSQEELRYKHLFHTIHELICIHNPDTSYLEVSPAAEAILGYLPEELLGLQPKDFIHPEDIARIMCESQAQVLSGNTVDSLSYRVRHKKGHYIWLDTKLSPILNEKGQVIQLLTASRDITARIQQENILKRTQYRIKKAQEIGLLGYWELDVTQRSLIWSEMTYKIYEKPYSEEPISIEELRSYHSSEELVHHRQMLALTLREGKEYKVEFRLFLPSGKIKYLRSVGTRIRDETTQEYRIIGLVQDITASYQQNQALKDKQYLLDNLTDQVPGLLYQFEIHDNGKIRIPYASPKMYEHLGVSGDQLAVWSDTYFPYLHEDDYDYFLACIATSKTQLSRWECDFRIEHPTRGLRWMHGSSMPERRANSVIWHGYLTDITERKASQVRLQESELKYRNLFEQMPQILWRATPEGKVVQGNQFALDKLAVQTSDIEDKGWLKLLHPEEAPSIIKKWFAHIQAQTPYFNEHRIRIHDGTYRWFRVYATPQKDSAGNVDSWIGLSLDVHEEHVASVQLQSLNYLFQAMLAHTNDFIFFKDLDHKLIAASDSLAQLVGYTRGSELEGKTDFEIFAPEAAHIYYELEVEVFRTKLRQGEEQFYTKPSGEIGYVDNQKYPIFDKSGALIGLYGIARDITEQKKAEQALLDSKALLQKITNSVPGIVFQAEQPAQEEATFTFISESSKYPDLMEIMRGIRDNTRTPLDFVHPLDKGYFISSLEQALASKSEWTAEYRIIDTKGQQAWHRITTTLDFDDNRQHITWYGILQNVSQQKQIEAELQKLDFIAEHTADIIFTCDHQGKVSWVNGAIEKVLGYPRDQFIGQSPTYRQVGTATNSEALARFNQALHKQKASAGRLKLYKENGQACWLDYRITPIHNTEGLFLYSILVQRDITGLIQQQEELQELLDVTSDQNERLRSFAHIVSHNIRSHSANLTALTKLLHETQNPEEFDSYLEMLQATTSKLDETILNLNEVISINNNLNKSRAFKKLQHEIHNTLSVLSVSLQKAQAQIHVEVDEQLQVNVVPAYLESILLNLLSNAVKYKHPKRPLTLTISAHKESNFTILQVKDNGLGINMHVHGDKLFGLYKTFHFNEDARGLGLFITKNQIEAMGGKITVQSEEELGSTFTVYFNDKP